MSENKVEAVKTSILRAARMAGVHRSTLHRWIDRKMLKPNEKGLVSIHEINALKAAQHLGRKLGKAYPNYEPDPNEDIRPLLNRGIEIIASAWRHANPNVRAWIDGELSRLKDESYLVTRINKRPIKRGKIGSNGELIEDGLGEAPSQLSLFSEVRAVPEILVQSSSKPNSETRDQFRLNPVLNTHAEVAPEAVPKNQDQFTPEPVSTTEQQIASYSVPKDESQLPSERIPKTQPCKQEQLDLL